MRSPWLLLGLLALGPAVPAVSAPLTPEQVQSRLRPIPVWVLTDAGGAPLVANGAFGVYLDKAEADAFLVSLSKAKPDLAKQVLLRPLPLSEIVRMTEPGSALQPEFVGARSEREAAKALQARTEKDPKPVGDAPMFVVRSGTAYLTVTSEGKSIIPIFFTKAQADEVVERFGRQGSGQSAHVEVAALEVILNALVGADDPDVARITLIPTTAMLQAAAGTR